MNKLLFIYNPTAGKGQANTHLSPVIDTFTKSGWLVTVYPTQCKGDAVRVARELSPQFDRVVCAGGDGTLSETVSGLFPLEAPPPLGYIPFGSTNDCAVTLNLPKDPKEAALAASLGESRPSDIGQLNGSPFVYVAAFGAFTQVSYDTPQDLKNTLGHLAYVLRGISVLPTISPYHLRIEYDGQVIEDDFFFGMVSNSLSVAGMKTPNREQVVLDDGLFEITLVRKPVSFADVANGFQSLLSQTPVGGPSALVRFQASHLVFTGSTPIPWTIDGEYGGAETVNVIQNCHKALNIIQRP